MHREAPPTEIDRNWIRTDTLWPTVTPAAIALILASAFAHAGWNYLAKKSGAGGVAFVWMYEVASAVLYLPLAILFLVVQRPYFEPIHLVFMVGSAILHAAYFTILQRAYHSSDLSVVYPLARGTGPLFSVVGAVLIFREQPSTLGLIGGAAVIAGVLVLGFAGSGEHKGLRDKMGAGIGYGFVTGLFIAMYTLWDAHAVAALFISPVLFEWANRALGAVMLSPFAIRRSEEVRDLWRNQRMIVVTVGILSPLAYGLVLFALVFTPVSYVAPAREISIVIGTALGVHALREGRVASRLTAASVVVVGVIALSMN